MTDQHLVLDASALVEVLVGGAVGGAVAARIEGVVLHAPAHVDAEVLSALGRLQRAGHLAASTVAERLGVLATAPVTRHSLVELVEGAWRRRDTLRLADALYVELAIGMAVPLVTTDARLAQAVQVAELVTA